MAEWTKAAVLKTAGRKPRGFESLSLRLKYNYIWVRGGAGVVERGRLLSGCGGKNLHRGFESHPPR